MTKFDEPHVHLDEADLANALAAFANESLFKFRSGTIRIPESDFVCYYNNNPHQGDEGDARRDAEIRNLIDALKTKGIRAAGVGAYPGTDDDQPGYTRTVLFTGDSGDFLSDLIEAARSLVDARMGQ